MSATWTLPVSRTGFPPRWRRPLRSRMRCCAGLGLQSMWGSPPTSCWPRWRRILRSPTRYIPCSRRRSGRRCGPCPSGSCIWPGLPVSVPWRSWRCAPSGIWPAWIRPSWSCILRAMAASYGNLPTGSTILWWKPSRRRPKGSVIPLLSPGTPGRKKKPARCLRNWRQAWEGGFGKPDTRRAWSVWRSGIMISGTFLISGSLGRPPARMRRSGARPWNCSGSCGQGSRCVFLVSALPSLRKKGSRSR